MINTLFWPELNGFKSMDVHLTGGDQVKWQLRTCFLKPQGIKIHRDVQNQHKQYYSRNSVQFMCQSHGKKALHMVKLCQAIFLSNE